MLDEKKFPTIVYAENYTEAGNTIIRMYDIENMAKLIIEFILPIRAYFQKNTTVGDGLTYNDGILTLIERTNPMVTDPKDNNYHSRRVTRYLLSNQEDKIKKISAYTMDGYCRAYDNRLFCSLSNGCVNIHDVSDGRLIESFFEQMGQRIETTKMVAFESKTQIILYCTLTDRKNVIDKQINGVLYSGNISTSAGPGVAERRELSIITELGKNHIVITMHTEKHTQSATILYKLIEETDVEEKDQCCVCFHFTEMNKALIPCGHTQFCEKCIGTLKICPLCEKEISSILPIYR
jgi:hypothetical protein